MCSRLKGKVCRGTRNNLQPETAERETFYHSQTRFQLPITFSGTVEERRWVSYNCC